MATNGMTEAQRYDWATRVLKREQGKGTHGTVTFFLENGVITRSKVEANELPSHSDSKSSPAAAAFTKRGQ